MHVVRPAPSTQPLAPFATLAFSPCDPCDTISPAPNTLSLRPLRPPLANLAIPSPQHPTPFLCDPCVLPLRPLRYHLPSTAPLNSKKRRSQKQAKLKKQRSQNRRSRPHSRSPRVASRRSATPTISVNAIKLEPPYEIKGRGIPIIGIKPIVMPTFSKKCTNKIPATPYI